MNDRERISDALKREWVGRQTIFLYALVLAFVYFLLPSPFGSHFWLYLVLFAMLLPAAIYVCAWLIPSKSPLWAKWEQVMNWLYRLPPPEATPSNMILATGFEAEKSFWGRRGQLTLTGRRLIFQVPRLRFLPPLGPITPEEYDLSAISDASVDTDWLASLPGTRNAAYVLRIQFRDGKRMEFQSVSAEKWRQLLLHARRDAAL
jgi:hypothetical protein